MGAPLSNLPGLPFLYCTQGDCEAVLSAAGVMLRLDDDQTEIISADEQAYLNTLFIPWSSSRINMYLMARYDAAYLAQSFTVNNFAAIMTCFRLCRRRGNPSPACILDEYKETTDLLKEIKHNTMSLEDVPERTSGSIMWRNIYHSRHQLRRNRVQRPISEQTNPGIRPVTPDLVADYMGSELYWL